MHIDLWLALGGLFVGFVVGLTGMGGGALMTPMLVLFFGVQPLAAVSSDLVTSLIMKPVGGLVHLRRGTVDKRLVGWLALGSVPAAFAGVLVLRALGNGDGVQNAVKISLGVALVVAAGAMVAKPLLAIRRGERAGDRPAGVDGITIRPVPTVLIGVVGGLVVGMTSVGSGSLIIVALLLLYPRLKANDLVGTDLVQAVPLVAAASLGHLLFGDFQLAVTASLLIGALPGVYLGARSSATLPGGIVRRALVLVLLASSFKLLGLPTGATGVLVLAIFVLGPLAWAVVSTTEGGRHLPRSGDAGPVRTLVGAATGRVPQPRPAAPERESVG